MLAIRLKNDRSMAKHFALYLHGARKGDLRTQFAALCYRIKNGKVQVLLVTSRRSKRWIMPKGWPMEGKSPAMAAAQEAWEEAGARGKVSEVALGAYSYAKVDPDRDPMPCIALLFPLKVKTLEAIYPEHRERRRKWVSRKKAAKMVEAPDLAKLILDFDARPKKIKT